MSEEVTKEELSKAWQFIGENELAGFLKAPFSWIAAELERQKESFRQL